jgi:putative FmdB family regulatory protein
VAVYEYVCPQDGRFDIRRAIGTAPDFEYCPTCHSSSRRAFSPPMVGLVGKPAKTLLAADERSSDSPTVVTEVPPKVGKPAPPPHPALARLPRP